MSSYADLSGRLRLAHTAHPIMRRVARPSPNTLGIRCVLIEIHTAYPRSEVGSARAAVKLALTRSLERSFTMYSPLASTMRFHGMLLAEYKATRRTPVIPVDPFHRTSGRWLKWIVRSTFPWSLRLP